MRPIDADALIHHFYETEYASMYYIEVVKRIIDEQPTLSPDDVRGVGCPVCQCEEPLPEDAMTHEFYIRGSMLWYYDQLFGWEGKRIAFCPFCGKQLRMKGGNNGHEKAD